MNKRLIIWTCVLTLLCVAAITGLVASLRHYQKKVFQRPRHVQTAGGTNYVLQLVETAIGKTDRGYLLLVTVEFENPNLFDMRLRRREFVLKDDEGLLYEPMPTAEENVVLPGRETFSYILPESALEGVLKFRASPSYWAQLRGEFPYTTRLREGQFRAYHRRDW